MSPAIVATPAVTPAPAKPTARLTLDHGQLTRALKIAEFAVAAKSPAEAQRGVLIETGRGRATLTTFDYETAVSVTVPGSARKGGSLLHFAQLQKALAAMVAGETKAQAERTSVSLSGDLLSTEHLTVPIGALEMEEFTRPPEPVPAMATVDAGEFFAELKRVLPAAGRDDTMPVLTAVHLALSGQNLTMAATDRYRLAVGQVRAKATVRPMEAPLSVLFPADVLTALLKRFKAYDGRIGVGLLDTGSSDIPRATLSLGDTTVTVHAREGKFPDYSSFFPAEAAVSVRMDRATLVRAAKKGHAMAQAVGGRHSPIALHWSAEGTLCLAPVIGSPAEQARVKGMSVPFTLTRGAGDDVAGMSVNLNPAFLLAALDAFTGQEAVTLHVRQFEEGQARRPVVLTADVSSDDGYRHLLMPIRLDRSK
ncbi:DNA polymerase III subunit beta [Streptomyces sp. NBC_01601]|uniref:DNA polymerase III subunit beta n=1 Tax=Streptomyces sp. NBC_01601 TaxID=2975892 RepID=UPI002E2921BE|nr:DNA polymerase III subunit beta [Streptomyces sp. NBC_01601]